MAECLLSGVNEDIYNFPPFFTLQPVEETKAKQLQLWSKVICDWAKATNTWALVPSKCPLWENAAIGRRLNEDGQAAVVAHLIKEGNATWESPEELDKGRLRIMWRTAIDVAIDLWEHARAAGMFGSVYTLYELHSGDVSLGTAFEGMDPWLLREAIGVLEGQGKATLFPGASANDEGVKFADV